MKKNVGQVDKFARILFGLGIGALGYFFNSWLGLLGIVPIAMAFIGFCPLYSLFGISTCKKK